MNKQKLYEKGIVFARYFLVSAFITALFCVLALLITGKKSFSEYASLVVIPLCAFVVQGASSFLLNPRSRKNEEREFFWIPFVASFAVILITHLIVYGFVPSKLLFIFLYFFCGFLGMLFGLFVASMK